MRKPQRTCAREFKVEAVELVQASKKPLAQIARDLGISDSASHHWCKQFSEHGEQAFPGSGHQTPQEEEIRQLKRENDLLRQERDILKKRFAHLFAQSPVKFQFIAEQSHEYSITLLCQALEVSESGSYAWRSRPVSQRCREDAKLSAEIQQVFLNHRQVYGSPRIHAVLEGRGIHCSRKRVVRLMQQLGLSAQTKRSRKPTTKSDPRARFAPHLLNREFSAEEPNTKWVTDTKAVETSEGWL